MPTGTHTEKGRSWPSPSRGRGAQPDSARRRPTSPPLTAPGAAPGAALASPPWPGGLAPLLLAATGWLAVYRLNGPLWDAVVYDAAGLDPSSRLGSGLHFFCYDTVKIALLLTGIIFVVTVLRSYITLERTRALLGGRRQGVGNVAAAGLGVVTPFCSCSAVPAFIGFVAAGVPIGVTLSFLIASPLVNEVAVVLLYGLFGFKIAALYVTSGLLIAIVAGWALGRLHVERWVEPFVFQTTLHGRQVAPGQALSWSDRMALGREEVTTILRKIWPYLLVGHRPRRTHPRLGPRGLLRPLRRPGQPAGPGGGRRGGGAAVLQRRRRAAPRPGAAGQRPRDGHRAGVHDEHRRAVTARDDPAPPGAATPAARRLRRRRRHRRSWPPATCSTSSSDLP